MYSTLISVKCIMSGLGLALGYIIHGVRLDLAMILNVPPFKRKNTVSEGNRLVLF